MSARTTIQGDRGAFLALGFGTTVAMWAVGYFCRMPGLSAPGWLLLLLMLLALAGGGLVAGRLTGGGWTAGLRTGALASLLNLLILGSLLAGDHPSAVVPSALWWVPGSILLGMVLGALGGALGSGGGGPHARNWTGAFAKVAASATFLLLIAGGLVTSKEAGLAVVDWPNSFGYNMFLFPLSRMSGGIYYEHAHRLLGSLVGLTTLVLAVHVFRTDARRWLKGYLLLAVLLVVAQGALGGLRVTGHPTLSTSASDMAPNITLAVVHGVVGHLFLGVIVSVAVVTSALWLEGGPPKSSPSARTDRALSVAFAGLLLVQLALGATLRHLVWGLLAHIAMASAVVLLAVVCGMRASSLHPDQPAIRNVGRAIIGIATTQLVLGVATLGVTGVTPDPHPPSPLDVALTTTHQLFGAILLAHVVMLVLWSFRLITPGNR